MVYFISILGTLGIIVIIRMIQGPTIWDRLLTFNQLSSKITISIVMLSIITSQSFLLDIAIVYTLLSFIATVLIARFVRERGGI
ncbi:MAG: monovalent cation/H+ antiporter complex subunit F [Eubacteriales bacterium]